MIALSQCALTFRAVLELFHLGGAGRVGEAGRAPLDHAASARALPLACQSKAIVVVVFHRRTHEGIANHPWIQFLGSPECPQA